MENASKALTIAASILIAIILITLIVVFSFYLSSDFACISANMRNKKEILTNLYCYIHTHLHLNALLFVIFQRISHGLIFPM